MCLSLTPAAVLAPGRRWREEGVRKVVLGRAFLIIIIITTVIIILKIGARDSFASTLGI